MLVARTDELNNRRQDRLAVAKLREERPAHVDARRRQEMAGRIASVVPSAIGTSSLT